MDNIFQSWLQKQHEEGMALAAQSDVLALRAISQGAGAPQHYIARFSCKTFVLAADGEVVKVDRSEVGIAFPSSYLREACGYEVLTWLRPTNVFHPNIRGFICLGEQFVRPGTPLVEILFQLHAVISWSKWASQAPLNETAAQWARSHQHMFPSDPTALKRRALNLQVSVSTAGKGAS